MEPQRLHFLFGAYMDTIWRDIVVGTLDAAASESREAVAGAKLKQLVTTAAREKGLEYPPAGHENERFAEFLGHFGKDIVVFRRKGRDILVAPVATASLLFEPERDAGAQLRADVFSAFTQIPKLGSSQRPWYIVATDQFTWAADAGAAEPAQVKAVPPATIEVERTDREAFVTSAIPDEQTQEAMRNILEGHSALWAFSQALRTRGLSRSWHTFRLGRILSRIRNWCTEVDVPWRAAWLSDGEASPKALSNPTVSLVRREGLHQLFAKIPDSDLQRITVPLDIVLKLLQG